MKNDDEILDFILDKVPVYLGSNTAVIYDFKKGKISRDEAKKELLKSMENSRKILRKNEKIYQMTLEHAYDSVVEIFKKYDFNNEKIISKKDFLSKIIILPFYEFMAQNDFSSSETLGVMGVNYDNSGQIMLNASRLMAMDPEAQIRAIKHTAIHELLHGVSTKTYWDIKSKNKNEIIYPRRNGLLMFN